MTASKSSPPVKKSHALSSIIERKFNGRNGLLEYLRDPANHPSVLDYNNDFVIIKDLYPKAIVHLLILPRDLVKVNTLKKPFKTPHSSANSNLKQQNGEP